MWGKDVLSYQASARNLKDEVDLYMENQADFGDVGNVEFKPWQESKLEYVQQTCDGKIFLDG